MAKWIDVSTSQHQLKLFDGNRLIKAYPIAVGKILSPTPSGTYTIINKQLQSRRTIWSALDGIVKTSLRYTRNK